MQIKVKISKQGDSYTMSFVAQHESFEDDLSIPPKALADFEALRPEFESRLMEPGVREEVGKRIEELSEKWFGKDGKYVLIHGIGFMNRGSPNKI